MEKETKIWNGIKEGVHFVGTVKVLSLKSATYLVSWDFACKRQKFILLYIFLA